MSSHRGTGDTIRDGRRDMLTIAGAMRIGLRTALRNHAAVVWTYVLVSLAALPAAVVAGALVQDRFGSTLVAGDFARRLQAVLGMELLREEKHAVSALGFIILGSVVLWELVSTYLAGATMAAVSRAEPSRTDEFFSGGGRVFGRLLRLLPLALPFTLVAAGLPIFALYKASEWITEDMISERGSILIRWTALLVAALFVAWVTGAHDLMRVEAVARGEHRARYAFLRGLMRASRRPFALLALCFTFGALGVAITLLASLADVDLPRSGYLTIALGLVLQQAIAFVRATLRIALMGAEVAYVMLSEEGGRRSTGA